MFRIRHQFATLVLIAGLAAGCQAIATTGLAFGNRLTLADYDNAAPVPLHSNDLDINTLGSLAYRGGLDLTSQDERFGGLSGLLIISGGKEFLSVSDKGYWVTGALITRDGELSDVTDIKIAPMQSPGNGTIEGKEFGDAESLIGDPEGLVYVSFEGEPRVWAYDLSEDGFEAKPVAITLPDDAASLKNNGGLEGIVQLKDKSGTLLILSEATTDAMGNFKGWLLKAEKSSSISLKPIKPFNLTDLAVLPNGDVLTLERRFSIVGGPGFQIRRIDGASIQPGAVLDGPVLANAGLPWTVDNMEGLDVRVTADGRVLLYLVSDNNFNPLQRTLLMMFELNE